MSGDPVFCQCPNPWFGTVPPVCPVHNPATFKTSTASASTVGYGTWSAGWITDEGIDNLARTFTGNNVTPPSISDDDVERIARRVVEMLKERE